LVNGFQQHAEALMSETFLTGSQPYCNTRSLFSLSSIPDLQIIVPEHITVSSHSSLQ